MTPNIASEFRLPAANHVEPCVPQLNRFKSIARNEARSNALTKNRETKDSSPDKGQKLKAWPDDVRGVPNAVLRSALFGAIRKGSRALLERENIVSFKGQKIRYTGTRLDQIDLTVWLCVLHLARQQALGQELHFTAYSLLKLMKKTDTGKNRKILHERLLRLKTGGVEITQGNLAYIGCLIKDVHREEQSSKYVVILDAKLHLLFPSDGFTYVDWRIRSALDRQPLAQWLHGFYSSHAKPFPMKVATLHSLCGSEAHEIWKFTQTLRRALSAVSATCEAHDESFSYDIRGDLVHIERQPSGSQQCHLLRTLKKPQKTQRKYRSSG